MIKGVNFDNQLVTAKQHGALFASAFHDGILSGMELSFTGSVLTVAGGYCTVCGREIQLTGAETISVSGTTGYARILVQIDLSQTATTSDFSQVSLVTQYAASLSEFPALTQDDVNSTSGTIYQTVLCVLALGTDGIASIASQAGTAAHRISAGTADPSGGSDGDIYIQYTE